MMEKFRNKYRIESTRLKGYDYGRAGSYFITVVTKKREHYFGEIIQGVFNPTELGKVVETEWIKTAVLRGDMNISLPAFVVMPNHFHGIITIGNNRFNIESSGGNRFGPQSKNIGSVMRGFKSAVTMYARRNKIVFDWQTGFYDRILRNTIEMNRTINYINANPSKWNDDELK